MDEEDFEDETKTLSHIPQRSTNFTKLEVKTLIKLIETNKSIILNKSTTNTTNHTKEITWAKIAKEFNNQGFKNKRTGENLRTKWENLKKEARKLSKNIIKVEYNEYHYLLNDIICMLNETEPNVDSSDLNEEQLKDDNTMFWDEDKPSDIEYESQRKSRSLNFSPQECSLLLQCVKTEKEYIFSKESTGQARKDKNRAWSRITSSYNNISPEKRTSKMLREKFKNMKKLAKKANVMDMFNNGHRKLEEEQAGRIKSEHLFEYSVDMDTMSDVTDHHEEELVEELRRDTDQQPPAPDPLSTILSNDSGIDSINHFGCLNPSQDKEIVKLQLDLLKYQLETAKIERQRIEEKTEWERNERESKAKEMSLRLRAARLELIAAEEKLPASHTALQYGYGETKAKEYMQQFTNT